MMHLMALTEEQREAEVAAALADAGYTAEQVRFYRLDHLGEDDHVGAAWYRPGMRIPDDSRNFRDDNQRAQANEDDARGTHRIIVPAHPTNAVIFAALLRHELEHARQFDHLRGRITDLHDFVEHDVLPEVAGSLDGCGGALINAIPTEVDCNAAASVYIAERFSEPEVQAVRDDRNRRQLACSLLPPPAFDTLPARMIAFAYIHRAAVEAHAERRGFDVRSILRLYDGADDLWQLLEQAR
jgi:hypothetical protein